VTHEQSDRHAGRLHGLRRICQIGNVIGEPELARLALTGAEPRKVKPQYAYADQGKGA
jgi:hypothetical protein